MAGKAAPPAPTTPPAPDAGLPSAGHAGEDAGAPEDDAGALPPSAAGCKDCCRDGMARGQAANNSMTRRLAAFTPSPADVTTCLDGRVFLTLDGQDEVWRIPENGPPEHYADVTGVQPAGIACDARGRVFVSAFSLRRGSKYSAPGVLLLEPGQPARMLPAVRIRAGITWPICGLWAECDRERARRKTRRNSGAISRIFSRT